MSGIPLFLGLRSTQSPIKAPRRSTDPATTKPNTAVNSRLRPYSSIRNTEIAKCHMRSPYLDHNTRSSLCVVFAVGCLYVLTQFTGSGRLRADCISPGIQFSGKDSYPHWQRSTDIDEKLGTFEVDKSWTLGRKYIRVIVTLVHPRAANTGFIF